MAEPVREIAIIGAGNGGCAAAADLTLRGFSVRLYGRSATTIAPVRERGGIELAGALGEHFAPLGDGHRRCRHGDPRRRPGGADGPDPRARRGRRRRCASSHRGAGPAGGAGPHRAPDPRHVAPQRAAASVRSATPRACPISRARAVRPRCASRQAVPLSGVRGVSRRAHRRARRAPAPGLPGDPARRQPAGDGVSLRQRNPPSAGHSCAMPAVSRRRAATTITTTTASARRSAADRRARSRAARGRARARRARAAASSSSSIATATPPRRRAPPGLAYEAFHQSEPDRWIRAPTSLDHRFLDEDVPYGLVPLSELGRFAGVPTPTIDHLIHLAAVAPRPRTIARRASRSSAWGLNGRDPAGAIALLDRGYVN